MTTPKLRLEIGGQALSRRQLADKQAAKRLLRKLLKKQMRTPRFMITPPALASAARHTSSWLHDGL